MERRKKIGLVVLVLGAGIGLALQYRKGVSENSSADPITPAKSDGSAPLFPAWQHKDFSTAQSQTAGKAESTNGDMANSQHGSTRMIDPVSTVPRPNLSSLVEVHRAGAMVDLRAPEKTHTIVDGDTLAKLAVQYLGSAERSTDLFQHNRDVLRNPDELPIGAVLRIPLLVTLPAPSNNVVLSPAQVAPPLVPASQTAPMKLNRLINSDTAKPPSNQRTYTVQPGDSLVDIARKFYGDGRRYDILFEANRRVLPTPTQLKPGTVLVVP